MQLPRFIFSDVYILQEVNDVYPHYISDNCSNCKTNGYKIKLSQNTDILKSVSNNIHTSGKDTPKTNITRCIYTE